MPEIEKLLDRKIGRAIFQYGMIQEGDRILAAVSGGKDSLSLLYHLLKKQRSFPIKFDLMAIHIKTEFRGGLDQMETLLKSWDAPYEFIEINMTGRLKPGRKMNCYWCSTQRRTELLQYAKENGYNKIALGHHMDDILETFIMNMAYKSELSTMLPVLQYDNYPHTVIRPLALVKEEEILKFADKMGIRSIVCDCGFDVKSKRKNVRKFLDDLADGEEFIKDNMYKAMSNPVSRYLPGVEARQQE
ncbi:MAG: tRNA 2-thiocytidine biosynthesis protein TtcA [Spirochaetales bacterium]|nr:tRNA 2-thiocytidine biosynthesis protein TtcA [Spirochaetales bacterium]